MSDPSYELYMVRGPQPGKTIPLVAASYSLGRDPQSDFVINDPEVSRQQALLVRTSSGEYRIQDLGSTNGTYVDGQRLGANPVILRPLQAVTLGGGVTLILRRRDESAKASLIPDDLNKENPIDDEHIPEAAEQVRERGDAQPDVSYAQSPGQGDWHRPTDPKPESKLDKGTEKPVGVPVREGKRQGVGSSPTQQASVSQQHETAESFSSYEGESAQGLSPNLILGLVLVLLCGCLATLLFMLTLGGDWLLRQAGLVP